VSGGEQVVLCGPDGAAVGTADKSMVHHADTPLHLAFSCYLFDDTERLLVTRRARTKLTWPGVRTNSCCGHPGLGESMRGAVRRRLHDELGVTGADIDLIVPQFRYRATMADGIVENELCPIYRATVTEPRFEIAPAEVDSAWWMPWPTFLRQAGGPDPLSPWSVLQVASLQQAGASPADWARGDPALLPSAAVP
jgi:isopentenyl-diphosphate delta-isomerase